MKKNNYCTASNIGCSLPEVYDDGYIAGLKEMYAVLSEMLPSGIIKDFDVDEYMQSKQQKK